MPTRSELLASREFVCDMAKLAEHIVMNDVDGDFWAFDASRPDAIDTLRLSLHCREPAAFFAPDKLGEHRERPAQHKERCEVRRKRAAWTVAFKQVRVPPAISRLL